jgi:hypothetical protein
MVQLEKKIVIIGGGTLGLLACRWLLNAGFEDLIVLDRGNSEASMNTDKIKFSRKNYNGVTKGRRFGLGGTSTIWGAAMLFPGKRSFSKNKVSEHLLKRWRSHSSAVLREFCIPTKFSPQKELGKNFYLTQALWPKFSKRNTKSLISLQELKTHVKLNTVVDNISALDESGKNVLNCITDGERYTIICDYVIMTCGAIENTRLLLRSVDRSKEYFKDIGRNFGDHISVPIFRCSVKNETDFRKLFVLKGERAFFSNHRIEFSDEKTAGFIHFTYSATDHKVVNSFRRIMQSIQMRSMIEWKDILSIIGSPIFSMKFVWNYLTTKEIRLTNNGSTEVHLVIESVICPTNNIRLSEDSGEIEISWELIPLDYNRIQNWRDKTLNLFTSSDLLKNIFDIESVYDFTKHKLTDSEIYHPTGTTQICGDDHAVINEDLSVKNFKNVYCVSTGILPHSGSINPTFTIMCALRECCEGITNAQAP